MYGVNVLLLLLGTTVSGVHFGVGITTAVAATEATGFKHASGTAVVRAIASTEAIGSRVGAAEIQPATSVASTSSIGFKVGLGSAVSQAESDLVAYGWKQVLGAHSTSTTISITSSYGEKASFGEAYAHTTAHGTADGWKLAFGAGTTTAVAYTALAGGQRFTTITIAYTEAHGLKASFAQTISVALASPSPAVGYKVSYATAQSLAQATTESQGFKIASATAHDATTVGETSDTEGFKTAFGTATATAIASTHVEGSAHSTLRVTTDGSVRATVDGTPRIYIPTPWV